MGVLEHDERGDRLMDVVRPERCPDLGRIHPAAPIGHELADGGSHNDRMARLLIEDRVGARVRDDLTAPRDMRDEAHEVAHRAAGHEQARLLAQEVGSASFQLLDGRVVLEHIVPDARGHHRLAHRGRWLGDRVRPEVDELGHRWRSITGLPARLRVRRRDPWCSGPTCQPVTLEIAGSNPVGSAIDAFSHAPSARPDGASFCPAPRAGGPPRVGCPR